MLIVDDHPSFRASARALLEAEGFDVVGEADDGESAVQARGGSGPTSSCSSAASRPDGFEVASRLTGNGSVVNVVLVSSRDGCDYGPLVEGSGASGFVPKAELSGARIAALLR